MIHQTYETKFSLPLLLLLKKKKKGRINKVKTDQNPREKRGRDANEPRNPMMEFREIAARGCKNNSTSFAIRSIDGVEGFSIEGWERGRRNNCGKNCRD